MPRFDYKCNVCGVTVEKFVAKWDDEVKCSSCGNTMTKIPSFGAVHVWPAEGIHLKHVSPNGHTFHSHSEMVTYARVHDLELGALL